MCASLERCPTAWDTRPAMNSAFAPAMPLIALPPSTDPAPYANAGATWWLTEFEPEASREQP